MVVDSSLGTKLRINLNITFPALSCAEMHVDAMDVAGDYHPYMEQNMIKQRLDKNGVPIGKTVEETANVVENKEDVRPADYCGSCYGAEEFEGDCCNTCEQVLHPPPPPSDAGTFECKPALTNVAVAPGHIQVLYQGLVHEGYPEGSRAVRPGTEESPP